MKIIFIRHGETLGNVEKRYIGRTDLPLCEAGRQKLMQKTFPDCGIVFTSSLLRCRQTAQIIYPDKKCAADNGLDECDFGDFEGKKYSELNGDPYYQAWIDSSGTLAFPNGESPEEFKNRSAAAFDRLISKCDADTAAFVVHGGTIMALLEKYTLPKAGFYDNQVSCGCGFVCRFDGRALYITESI